MYVRTVLIPMIFAALLGAEALLIGLFLTDDRRGPALVGSVVFVVFFLVLRWSATDPKRLLRAAMRRERRLMQAKMSNRGFEPWCK